jgi:hypothetical protein
MYGARKGRHRVPSRIATRPIREGRPERHGAPCRCVRDETPSAHNHAKGVGDEHALVSNEVLSPVDKAVIRETESTDSYVPVLRGVGLALSGSRQDRWLTVIARHQIDATQGRPGLPAIGYADPQVHQLDAAGASPAASVWPTRMPFTRTRGPGRRWSASSGRAKCSVSGPMTVSSL